MVSSGMLHRVALVRTGVSEELSASFIKVTRVDEIGTMLDIILHRRNIASAYEIIFVIGHNHLRRESN
jgi:hypothetical protein